MAGKTPMPLSKSEFQAACLGWGVNWPGTAEDNKPIAQRLDELSARLRVVEKAVAALQAVPPGTVDTSRLIASETPL